MHPAASTPHRILVQFGSLVKIRQTLLLTLTGAAGFLCQGNGPLKWFIFSSFLFSLFFTISGCTVLNMLFDRDLDSRMERTRQRPLAAGQMNLLIAAILGTGLIVVGLVWALALAPLYFVIDLAGALLNVFVYTLWLKRRSAWSILWGGLAGGMPILAGHTLAIGRLDTLGVLLSLVIVVWIPSHNLTLNILKSEDYIGAGLPTIFNVYGLEATRHVLLISSLLTSILAIVAFSWLAPPVVVLWTEVAACAGLLGLAFLVWIRPALPAITLFFKYSSLFMLGSMLLLAITRLK